MKGSSSFILFVFLSIVNCRTPQQIVDVCSVKNESDQKINILTLGDSRVEGHAPKVPSYRYNLWKNFIKNGWNVDFIGPKKDPYDYPTFMGKCFDNEHLATVGATTDVIIRDLKRNHLKQKVDIVLIGIGGNDFAVGEKTPAEIAANIAKIIRIVKRKNEGETIFIEQFAYPLTSLMSPTDKRKLDRLSTLIAVLAERHNQPDSPVYLIDMRVGWSDEFLVDDRHYNDRGAKFIADKYFKAIQLHYKQILP